MVVIVKLLEVDDLDTTFAIYTIYEQATRTQRVCRCFRIESNMYASGGQLEIDRKQLLICIHIHCIVDLSLNIHK